MRKWLKVISGILVIGLTLVSYLQYQNNSKLKDDLGSTYLSNMGNFNQHLTRVENYLQNEKEFKESDLLNYYYEVNYLMTVRLPSNLYTSAYLQFIQSGIGRINDLVAKGGNQREIETVKSNTLQLIKTLNEALVRMGKAGEIRVGNSMHGDYKKYYQLSLPNNKAMKSINADLERRLNSYIDYLNKNNIK
jgi:hypothetical protein